MIAVAQLSAGLQTLRSLFGSLCFLDVNCTVSNHCHYPESAVFQGHCQHFSICFHKLCVPEASVLYVLHLQRVVSDGLCQGTRLPEVLLGFVLSHSVLLRLSFSLGPTFRVVTAQQRCPLPLSHQNHNPADGFFLFCFDVRKCVAAQPQPLAAGRHFCKLLRAVHLLAGCTQELVRVVGARFLLCLVSPRVPRKQGLVRCTLCPQRLHIRHFSSRVEVCGSGRAPPAGVAQLPRSPLPFWVLAVGFVFQELSYGLVF